MKKTNEKTLKEAIADLINVYRLKSGLTETKLKHSWETVSGELITRHTEKVFLRKETLYVKLDSPALKHELNFSKSKLIKSLNNTIQQEAISEIVFL